MTDRWTPIQQLTDEVLNAEHPSDLHIVGVTYDPVGRTATVNGKRVYRGQWIVREQDGSLSHRRYGTEAEQDAYDAAVGGIDYLLVERMRLRAALHSAQRQEVEQA